jgi:hypothetical protein
VPRLGGFVACCPPTDRKSRDLRNIGLPLVEDTDKLRAELRQPGFW